MHNKSIERNFGEQVMQANSAAYKTAINSVDFYRVESVCLQPQSVKENTEIEQGIKRARPLG